MDNIVTIPMDKIDIFTLMLIYNKEYVPIIGSERVVDGQRYIDFEKTPAVGFISNPKEYNFKKRKEVLNGLERD